MRIICLTMLIFSLASCTAIDMPIGINRGMTDGAPNGTPTFKLGWKNGCESGMTLIPAAHMKATHDYVFDPNFIASNEYLEAWFMGLNHCRWYGQGIYRHMS